ncbi:MAG: flavodoxin family protein [Clostridiales bacterium]|nr:flavodoxin family protein [Clostridiales bacterium]
MKIIAFGAGRKDGNTEIYIKEALMAAEEMGLEVEYVRLRDFEIHTCGACSMQFCPAMDDPTHCVYGYDDSAYLLDKFLDADGVLIGSPVYSTTGSSLFYAFRDRLFGPKVDDVMMERFGTPEWAEGRMKHRPGAIISVGGTLSKHWVSMGIPSLYSACFPPTTLVVDYMNITGIANPGAAVLNQELLDRAHTLGENLARATLENDTSWRGDTDMEENVCPSCHYNCVLLNPKKKDAWCAICGIHAHISFDENGEMVLDWPEEEQVENHLLTCGKNAHGDEIGYVLKEIYMPNKDKIPERIKKYKAYTDCELKSPYHEAQKAKLREQYAKSKESET